ncbi:hypothetical protein SAY87_030159 [Trapa incisa]|uniref:Uncharacterized protein n=1 Tax=Trapa incisa TaxID=236973 RepID=A0AAN7QE21_9MYRT|nr:hypothetical protein SAY87_030159 [Trapa incisa]
MKKEGLVMLKHAPWNCSSKLQKLICDLCKLFLYYSLHSARRLAMATTRPEEQEIVLLGWMFTGLHFPGFGFLLLLLLLQEDAMLVQLAILYG